IVDAVDDGCPRRQGARRRPGQNRYLLPDLQTRRLVVEDHGLGRGENLDLGYRSERCEGNVGDLAKDEEWGVRRKGQAAQRREARGGAQRFGDVIDLKVELSAVL